MKSMTGYGHSHSESQWAELEVSLKCVNGRFLDLRFHMPREYDALESQLKKMIAAKLRRGTIEVSVYRRPGSSSPQGEVRIQMDLAREWVRSYQELGHSLGLAPELNLQQIAGRPEILKIEERLMISPKETQQVLKTLEAALKNCDQEREREGKALEKEMERHFDNLEEHLAQVQKLRTQANKDVETRMKSRLAQLELKTPVDPQRVAQEVAIYLDRADITEELSRLEAHIAAFRKLLKSREPVGKKLDFYTQELLREVNTIGSKTQVAKLTEHVVEAKAVIERIREQVQNIE